MGDFPFFGGFPPHYNKSWGCCPREPDHAGSIGLLLEKFPAMELVGNAKTFSMLPKYFPGDCCQHGFACH